MFGWHGLFWTISVSFCTSSFGHWLQIQLGSLRSGPSRFTLTLVGLQSKTPSSMKHFFSKEPKGLLYLDLMSLLGTLAFLLWMNESIWNLLESKFSWVAWCRCFKDCCVLFCNLCQSKCCWLPNSHAHLHRYDNWGVPIWGSWRQVFVKV